MVTDANRSSQTRKRLVHRSIERYSCCFRSWCVKHFHYTATYTHFCPTFSQRKLFLPGKMVLPLTFALNGVVICFAFHNVNCTFFFSLILSAHISLSSRQLTPRIGNNIIMKFLFYSFLRSLIVIFVRFFTLYTY